jgi:hypothetical protein
MTAITMTVNERKNQSLALASDFQTLKQKKKNSASSSNNK